MGKDVWDIGAHCGYTSLLCSKYGRGRVISFEPSTKNLEQFNVHLRGNPDLASQIQIVPAAVSDADGEITFLVRDDGSMCQIESPSVQLWENRCVGQTTRVKTVRLDSLLKQGRPGPGLLKIDIEGAEALALAGAAQLLRDYHPIVVLEVHNRQACMVSIAFLKEAGLTIRQITGNRLKELTKEPIAYGHLLATDPRVAASV